MRSPIGFTLFSKLFLVLLAIHATKANQESLISKDFIRFNLYCVAKGNGYEVSTINEHYFYMFKTNSQEKPVDSFAQILEAGQKMLIDFQESVRIKIETFKTEYMNFNHYYSNFEDARFKPFNNQVWTNIQLMFGNNDRFQDWMETRTEAVSLNHFTNLIATQRSLMEEFPKFTQLLAVWKQHFSQMEGIPDMDQVQQLTEEFQAKFDAMKQETIYYLALIFMAAFEHEETSQVVAKDNVLSSYWVVFQDWLELGVCNRLVHGAINGGLSAVQDIESLHQFLYTEETNIFENEVKLVWDFPQRTTLEQFNSVIPDSAGMEKEWEFYSEDQLDYAIGITEDDLTNQRIEFDMARLAEDEYCSTYITNIENFIGLNSIMKKKAQFLEDNVYYYFIEYLWKLINEHQDEFPDENLRDRSVTIIYIFMNHILNQDKDQIVKFKTQGEIIVHLILRILNGLGPEGDLRPIIKDQELDEPTENYIYMLLFILTEKNDLEKPEDSEELDRGREDSIIDDDEEPDTFRLDPNAKRFAKIIRRFFVLANRKEQDRPGFIKRYVTKFHFKNLLESNPIFIDDNRFFIMEVNMNKEFASEDRTFVSTKTIYQKAKTEWITANTQNNHNKAIYALIAWFGQQLKNFKEKPVPEDIKQNDRKKWMLDSMYKILLSKLSVLQSNFMEQQYMMAVVVACKSFKLPLPNMSILLQENMKDNNGLNMFEFVKRIISNIKHGRAGSKNGLVDTVDLNLAEFQDHSGIPNGERFRTMIMDIVHYFQPELERLKEQSGPTNKSGISYLDLEKTLKLIHSEFHLEEKKNGTPNKQLEDFRLIMLWNLFDDINEYMPLLDEFVSETKSLDGTGSNPLKIEMLVESYTDLYIAILEHRIFSTQNSFSYESAEDRINGLVSYLTWRNEQYEEMFTRELQGKEERFSKLSPRQVQNLLYFLEFRIMRTLEQEQAEQVMLSNLYFPYSFREIYVLLDNHPEMNDKIGRECAEFYETLKSEKLQRKNNYTVTLFDEETRALPNFKFCMLIAFNKDIVALIDSVAIENNKRSEMLTMTNESIYKTLVEPYYDKLSAHDMIMQIFNMNMTHAKAVARESAEKFSNYIALLDAFLFILNDLEDGQNDTLHISNLGNNLNETMVNFCKLLEATNEPENIKFNKIFIRHLLIEKLVPGFLAPGDELRNIFQDYAKAPIDQENIIRFSRQLRYGLQDNQMDIDLKENGEDIDEELLALLMIYAPHQEFTVDTIYRNNFMSSLPQYLRNAEDNFNRMNHIYVKPSSMEDIYTQANNTKKKIISATQGLINDEVEVDIDNNFNFDMDFGEMLNMDDEVEYERTNSQWSKEDSIVVDKEDLDSNIKIQDKISKVLVAQTTEMIELTSKDSKLKSNEEYIIDEMIQKSGVSEEMNLLKKEEQNLMGSGVLNIAELNVVSSSQDYAENMMETMNFNQKDQVGNKTKIIMSDHNESLQRKFSESVEEDTLQANINSMGTLRFGIKGVNSQEMMSQLQNATARIAEKLNTGQFQVKINKTSQSSTSEYLVNKRSTHVSQKLESFNNFNQELHITGNNDVVMKVVKEGSTVQMPIKTYKVNKVLTTVYDGQAMKDKLNTMISNNIMKMNNQSKSWSESSKSEKVVVKKRQIKSADNLYLI